MWRTESCDIFARRHRWYEKKRSRELEAVLVNLADYICALQEGVNPLQITFGFVHTEPMGVVAIDQRGKGSKLAQTRLYVYPDTDEKVLYHITIGDKNSQKDDIQVCREFVLQLRREKGKKGSKNHDSSKGDQKKTVR